MSRYFTLLMKIITGLWTWLHSKECWRKPDRIASQEPLYWLIQETQQVTFVNLTNFKTFFILERKSVKTLKNSIFCFLGQVLTYENIEEIIRFCAREKLVLFADEVYQANIHVDGVKFHSCKKVLRDLGAEYSNFQLISLHSSAKGYAGEWVYNMGILKKFVFIITT